MEMAAAHAQVYSDFINMINGIVGVLNLVTSTIEDMQGGSEGHDMSNSESGGPGPSPELDLPSNAVINIDLFPVMHQLVIESLPIIELLVHPHAPPAPVEIFTDTGFGRFQLEVDSANAIMGKLYSTQDSIAANAASATFLPPQAVMDLNTMAVRMDMIRSRIQEISSDPLNMSSDTANAELEQLRIQLSQASQIQDELSQAMDNEDATAVNDAYLRLSQIVSGTERYIRDNVDEQGRFNQVVEDSKKSFLSLEGMVSKMKGILGNVFDKDKIISFVKDGLEAFDTQLNTEVQLLSALGGNLKDMQVADYIAETMVTADTSEVTSEIENLQNNTNSVEITMEARTQALQAQLNSITSKASEIQAKGIYKDDVMIAGAMELSTHFSDADAVEMMMGTLADYAMGMNGVGEVDSSTMTQYAESLGKIKTGDYDELDEKGIHFTEAHKAIIAGTATEGQIVQTLGEEYLGLSGDMQAAAAITQVLQGAWGGLYETMSDTPQGQMIQLQNAWGSMMEVIGGKLYPYVLLFVDAIQTNWGTIEQIVSVITFGLQFMMGILSGLLEMAFLLGQTIMDNWSWIAPIVYGIAAAMAVYYGWLLWLKVAEIAEAVASQIASIAQWKLNAAFAACPVVMVIIAIIALIAIIYAVIEAINKATGSSISAAGVIFGVISVTLAAIGNILFSFINMAIDLFAAIWNFIAAFANFFANVFQDPVGAVVRLFFDLVDTALSLLQTLASAIDTIFGKDFSGLIQGWRDDISGWVDESFGEEVEVMEKINGEDWHFTGWDYGEAWDKGYAFGEGIDEKVGEFDLLTLFQTEEAPKAEDYAEQFAGYGGVQDDVSDIADNTGAISDSMDITQEDLKYLRDIAEQEAINRYTVAEVNIEQTNHNNVSSDMDLDGVVSGLTNAVNEAVDIVTEGVHT